MKIVDIRSFERVVANEYLGSPKMYIYHSTDEFRKSPFYESAIIIKNPKDFIQFLQDNKMMSTEKSFHLAEMNVWIKTEDKYVPKDWTTKGDINLQLFKGKVQKTDACYIQLISIFCGTATIRCYTSSGVYNASLTRWNFSGAVKPQYKYENSTNPNYTKEGGYNSYSAKLRRVLNKPVNASEFVRITHMIINPASECFLNPDLAVERVLKSKKIKKEDMPKVFEQINFKRTFIKEILMLDQNFRKTMQGKFGAEEIESMYIEMWNTVKSMAKEGKATAKDMREVVDDILKVTHKDEDITPENAPDYYKLPGLQEGEKLIHVDDTKRIASKDVPVTEVNENQLLGTKKELKSQPDFDSKKEEDEFYKQLEDETGSIDYTVIGDEQSNSSKD